MKRSRLVPLIAVVPVTMVAAAYDRPVAARGELPPAASVCTEPGHREFDFWIGTWEIDQTIHGFDGTRESFRARTIVRPVMQGCALVEEWEGRVRFPWQGMEEPDSLHGFSVRAYDPGSDEWSIHWMDSRNPSFGLPFVGGFEDGAGTFLRRTERPDGGALLSRIVFDQISSRSVRWRLSVSQDEGASWIPLWEMSFQRAPGHRRARLTG